MAEEKLLRLAAMEGLKKVEDGTYIFIKLPAMAIDIENQTYTIPTRKGFWLRKYEGDIFGIIRLGYYKLRGSLVDDINAFSVGRNFGGSLMNDIHYVQDTAKNFEERCRLVLVLIMNHSLEFRKFL